MSMGGGSGLCQEGNNIYQDSSNIYTNTTKCIKVYPFDHMFQNMLKYIFDIGAFGGAELGS